MSTNIVILEQCQVSPAEGGAAEKLLPLVDFDIMFLKFPLMQILMFYDLQCSKTEFVETIVPILKKSLSLTLKHYFPLAGNTTLPLISPATPFSRYVAGDSVSLTIAQSHADFVHLTGNHYRNADDFCDFVPKLPQATFLSDSIEYSLSAFQVTFFPGQGICLGLTLHHSVADGATALWFIRTWSSIAKFKGDTHLLASGTKYLPTYDRSAIIKDADRLSTGTWTRTKKSRHMVTLTTVSPPTHKVRATFTLRQDEIQQLKKLFVLNKKVPSMANNNINVSSFVIVCAYLWTCFAKSAGPDEVADEEAQYLACPGDCWGRMDPPLPDTYFGNCVAFMMGESTHGRLRRKEGMVEAVVAINKAIEKTFSSKKGVIDVSGYREFRKLNRSGVFLITGSPKFDLEGADFGWGGPKKTEIVHIDTRESVSLGKAIGLEGVQIEFSMSQVEMDAFAAVFERGISEAAVEENMFHSRI